MLTFWLWVIVLTLLLLYPVSKLIWVFSVRRLQRKLSRELDEQELKGQRNRAWVIAAFICFVFSMLYNFSTIGVPRDG